MGEKKDKRNGIEENRVGGFISWRKVSSLTLILVVCISGWDTREKGSGTTILRLVRTLYESRPRRSSPICSVRQ